MFYISAIVAIAGAVGYQYFVKRVPEGLNPIVSVLAMYLGVLAISIVLLLIFPPEGGLKAHFHQVSWIQGVLAVSIIMIEMGFLLMYRYGWKLSQGNIVTGVFVNVSLVVLGVVLLGENINPGKVTGIIICIVGVALISFYS